MPLTDLAIKKLKPRDKPYKAADAHGLYLYVTTSDSRSWRMKYRFANKEKLLTFGLYPEVKLAEARERMQKARAELRQGLDPGRRSAVVEGVRFEEVARDWHKCKASPWSDRHADDVLTSLAREVFPSIGARPINAVTTADVAATLRKIETRGAIETAHRIRQRIEAVFAFAIASGLAASNPGAAVKASMLKMPRSKPQPALTSLVEFRVMLRDVAAAPTEPVTKLATTLLALTAVRPGELRKAPWSEFDEEADLPVWTIDAKRMKGTDERKAGESHVVPLSTAAVGCVRQLRKLTGSGPLVFPSIRHVHKPMSENAIGYLLNRAGYHSRQTAHGFRSSFSTIMNEHFPQDRTVIDLMLAHTPERHSGSEHAYNRAKHMDRRRELAEEWAKLLGGAE